MRSKRGFTLLELLIGMALLGVLMLSHVPYAKVGRIGVRTPRGIANTVLALAALSLTLVVMTSANLYGVICLVLISGCMS